MGHEARHQRHAVSPVVSIALETLAVIRDREGRGIICGTPQSNGNVPTPLRKGMAEAVRDQFGADDAQDGWSRGRGSRSRVNGSVLQDIVTLLLVALP